MNVTFKIQSFTFTGQTEQEAYLNGCKKLAKWMASKKHSNITVKINRIKAELPTFEFVLYTNIDASVEQKEFCKACKEFHCSFYVNEEYNCDRCNLKAYLKRLQQRGNVSKGFYKKEINDR